MVDVFSRFILPNTSLSSKLKQSFFPWKTISDYLSVAQSASPKTSIQSFLLRLFGSAENALFPTPSQLTFSTHLPSTLFRVALALNPFKNAFDEELYVAIIRTHPEILPLLFAPANSRVSDIVSVDARPGEAADPLDAGTAGIRRVGANGGVFVRNSGAAHRAAKRSQGNGQGEKPEFLESIKGWLFPVVLSRSVVP